MMTEQTSNAPRFMDVYEDTAEQICNLENLVALATLCRWDLAETGIDRPIGREVRDGLIALIHAFTVQHEAIRLAHTKEHEWFITHHPKASNEHEVAALIEAHHKAGAAFTAASGMPGAGSNETPAELAAYKHMQDTAEQVTRIRPTSPKAAALLLQYFVHEYGDSAFGDASGDPDHQLIENVSAGLNAMRAA